MIQDNANGHALTVTSLLIPLNIAIFVFALMLFSVSLGQSIAYEFGVAKVIPSVMSDLLTSPGLIGDLLFFTLAYILAHSVIVSLWAYLWVPINQDLPWRVDRRTSISLAILSFLPLPSWLLFANSYFYPTSSFAFMSTGQRSSLGLALLLVMTTGYIFTIVIISSLVRLRAIGYGLSYLRRLRLGAISFILLLIFLFSTVSVSPIMKGSEASAMIRARPDIIIIGVDSVRVDHVGFFASTGTGAVSLTPNIDRLLSESAVMENAWTPLARTFPAWVSIFTGQYPDTHRAYFNLVPRELVKDADSLPHQLKLLGYQRLYGIDETRFSNIDETYGFDDMVAPAIGAADFLLAEIADLPLVNLIANTEIGRWIFPSIHMNRAMPLLYDPAIFERRLSDTIDKLNSVKPLFLAVHFELPHWPYRWSASDQLAFPFEPSLQGLSPKEYQAAVARVDEQVGALLDSLENSGRLDNAILIFFSDHGEAFVSSEPAWETQGNTSARIPIFGGHGTNVMSLAQYRIMLAFRGYGAQVLSSEAIDRHSVAASLVDIRPTVHDWLGIPLSNKVILEGISLAPTLRGDPQLGSERKILSLESGFSVSSMLGGEINHKEIAEEGATYYDVEDSGRLEIKETLIDGLRKLKQRAVLSDHWMLATFPNAVSDQSWPVLLADLKHRRYWDARDRHSIPPDAPLDQLLAELCKRLTIPEKQVLFTLAECQSG